VKVTTTPLNEVKEAAGIEQLVTGGATTCKGQLLVVDLFPLLSVTVTIIL